MNPQGVLVVSDLPMAVPSGREVGIVTAADYVAGRGFGAASVLVVNLCSSYDYLSLGYYVSILAEARGHTVFPGAVDLLALGNPDLVRARLAPLASLAATAQRFDEGSLSLLVVAGQTSIPIWRELATELFRRFRLPCFTVRIQAPDRLPAPAIVAIGPARLEPPCPDAFAGLARHAPIRAAPRRGSRRPAGRRPSLAVLHDPCDPLSPSSAASIEVFAAAAAARGLAVTCLSAGHFDGLADHAALFIRQTTAADDITYRFARRAADLGLPVIDDPASIVRCTNKVFLAERLARAGIATPRSLVVRDPAETETAARHLGFPLVLKTPDGAFSRGVHRVFDTAQAIRLGEVLACRGAVYLAQEYVETAFDWRVGVLAGEALFACKYHMTPGHWQIIAHERGGTIEGAVETVPLAQAPRGVVRLALAAASTIGDGLYGVDLKQVGDRIVVIEVNDNPNIDWDLEAASAADRVFERLADWFAARIAAREKGDAAPPRPAGAKRSVPGAR